MDADRFDELAVSLNAGRRTVLRTLVAGVTAALFAGGSAEAGPAFCGAPGEACRRSFPCCATRCKKKKGRKIGKCRPCPDGGVFCANFTGGAQCCRPGDGCEPGVGCTTVACRADNSFSCADPTPLTFCGGPPDARCVCARKADGGIACRPHAGIACPAASECDADADCEPGEVCLDFAGPGGKVCGCGPAPFGVCVTPCPID